MIICEYEFLTPDPKNPNYSLCEVDFYAWIPPDSGFPNHRLSLRKNLKTGEYEVYRRYHQRVVAMKRGLFMETHKDLGIEEVAFKSKSLEEAIIFANKEVRRFHKPSEGEWEDKVCQHKYPVKSTFCKAHKGQNV